MKKILFIFSLLIVSALKVSAFDISTSSLHEIRDFWTPYCSSSAQIRYSPDGKKLYCRYTTGGEFIAENTLATAFDNTSYVSHILYELPANTYATNFIFITKDGLNILYWYRNATLDGVVMHITLWSAYDLSSVVSVVSKGQLSMASVWIYDNYQSSFYLSDDYNTIVVSWAYNDPSVGTYMAIYTFNNYLLDSTVLWFSNFWPATYWLDEYGLYVTFNEDGTQAIYTNDTTIKQVILSTPYDLRTITLTKNFVPINTINYTYINFSWYYFYIRSGTSLDVYINSEYWIEPLTPPFWYFYSGFTTASNWFALHNFIPDTDYWGWNIQFQITFSWATESIYTDPFLIDPLYYNWFGEFIEISYPYHQLPWFYTASGYYIHNETSYFLDSVSYEITEPWVTIQEVEVAGTWWVIDGEIFNWDFDGDGFITVTEQFKGVWLVLSSFWNWLFEFFKNIAAFFRELMEVWTNEVKTFSFILHTEAASMSDVYKDTNKNDSNGFLWKINWFTKAFVFLIFLIVTLWLIFSKQD
jgi:hypothetical protein